MPKVIFAQNYIDSIIGELMYSIDRPSRMLLLDTVTDAVQPGAEVDPSIFSAIVLLATEGVANPARSGGRLVNSFPDIRVSACNLLGIIKTGDSKTNLLTVLHYDSDPTVLGAAVRALTNIGLNENDDVVLAIIVLQQRQTGLNRPSNTLAIEILKAYDFFSQKVTRKDPMVQSILAIITDYRYVAAVRKQAANLLQKLLKS
ncbi:MAG: HEAT repeat domain-containing protein [Treponema sp.]|jgi:hypothetical protein|nr:HEAT repeat domain-containing protein [Treponema sp.]